MVASHQISPAINKQTIIHGKTFATKNYAALLSHDEISSDFHIIHDFLALSDNGYALRNPEKVSYKSVMQV